MPSPVWKKVRPKNLLDGREARGEQEPDQQVEAEHPEHGLNGDLALRAQLPRQADRDRGRRQGHQQQAQDPGGVAAELVGPDHRRHRPGHQQRAGRLGQADHPAVRSRGDHGCDQGRRLQGHDQQAGAVAVEPGEAEHERGQDQEEDQLKAVVEAVHAAIMAPGEDATGRPRYDDGWSSGSSTTMTSFQSPSTFPWRRWTPTFRKPQARKRATLASFEVKIFAVSL